MTVTAGERLFEEYLVARGVPFDYEPDSGAGSTPDYRLKTDPPVHCEIKDFDFGPQDDAEISALRRGSRVGSKGPDALFGRIRDTIGKAAKQLRAHKGEPCVIVLHNANSFVNLAPFLVGGAMFGDPAISVPLGGGDTEAIFTGGRMLGDTKNTTVSAVAVLSRTNANQHLIDEAMARVGPWSGPGLPTADGVRTVMEAMGQLFEERPEAALKVPFLTVHHSPFAVVPLPDHVFRGPHDKHLRYTR